MYTKIEIEKIKEAYGDFSTWAIWDIKNEKDTSIIEENIELLHCNFVFIGLNISKKVSCWGNFRGGKHDRKIKYAFNSLKHIKGAYMTDLIKKVETKSTNLLQEIKEGKIDINVHVDNFNKELKLIGVTEKTKFILFGNIARELYDEFYERFFPNNKVYYLKHYSSYGNDKDWVENVWYRLNISDLNFEEEYDKYINHT